MLNVRVVLDPFDNAHLHAQPLVVLRLCTATVEVDGWVVHLLVMNVRKRLRRIVLVTVVLREHDGRGRKLVCRTLEDILEHAALQVIEKYDDVLWSIEHRVCVRQRQGDAETGGECVAALVDQAQELQHRTLLWAGFNTNSLNVLSVTSTTAAACAPVANSDNETASRAKRTNIGKPHCEVALLLRTNAKSEFTGFLLPTRTGAVLKYRAAA